MGCLQSIFCCKKNSESKKGRIKKEDIKLENDGHFVGAISSNEQRKESTDDEEIYGNGLEDGEAVVHVISTRNIENDEQPLKGRPPIPSPRGLKSQISEEINQRTLPPTPLDTVRRSVSQRETKDYKHGSPIRKSQSEVIQFQMEDKADNYEIIGPPLDEEGYVEPKVIEKVMTSQPKADNDDDIMKHPKDIEKVNTNPPKADNDDNMEHDINAIDDVQASEKEIENEDEGIYDTLKGIWMKKLDVLRSSTHERRTESSIEEQDQALRGVTFAKEDVISLDDFEEAVGIDGDEVDEVAFHRQNEESANDEISEEEHENAAGTLAFQHIIENSSDNTLTSDSDNINVYQYEQVQITSLENEHIIGNSEQDTSSSDNVNDEDNNVDQYEQVKIASLEYEFSATFIQDKNVEDNSEETSSDDEANDDPKDNMNEDHHTYVNESFHNLRIDTDHDQNYDERIHDEIIQTIQRDSNSSNSSHLNNSDEDILKQNQLKEGMDILNDAMKISIENCDSDHTEDLCSENTEVQDDPMINGKCDNNNYINESFHKLRSEPYLDQKSDEMTKNEDNIPIIPTQPDSSDLSSSEEDVCKSKKSDLETLDNCNHNEENKIDDEISVKKCQSDHTEDLCSEKSEAQDTFKMSALDRKGPLSKNSLAVDAISPVDIEQRDILRDIMEEMHRDLKKRKEISAMAVEKEKQIQTRMKNAKMIFKCNSCDYSSSSAVELDFHYGQEHSEPFASSTMALSYSSDSDEEEPIYSYA